MTPHLPDTFPPSPFTVLQNALDANRGASISLGQLRDALGDKSFGYLLILAVLPSAIPVPGLNSALGLLPMVLGFNLLLGGQKPWLPGFILNYKLPKKIFQDFFGVAEPVWRRYAAFIRPGWAFMCTNAMERLMGLFIIFMSFIIILPGPLTNVLPAIALVILAVGIIVKDGRVVLLSFASGAGILAVLTFLYGSLLYLLALGIKEVQTVTNL